MSNLKVRKSPLPSLWALIVLALCVAASMFITYRASAQSEKGAAPSVRPAPSKAEDSATIQDDPTILPDDKESADNNLTFPVDI